MSRFVLTAQLQLQAPNNVSQVVRQIQNQLSGVTVNVQVQGSAQAQRQIQQITNQTNQCTSAATRMGRAFAVSIRRFAAFSIATRAVGLFTSTLSDAIQTSIDFERQLIKVSQVTGKSVSQLSDLTGEITRLSTSLGVSSQSLLDVTTVLAQAGLTADDTKIALNSLAKAALAPNFDSITETAEGAIAILAQFKEGVGALEGQLGSINAVAGAFAVEAADLIDVIRRTGGVFKSSGGSLNELLALFTSVRATTRESAESIGTGLRTIFTRIQRPKTIEYLKRFGIELVDLEGKFVGPFEAVRKLSSALGGLEEGDITFIQIAEELGGFRQIGKVLPLLQQFSTAQAALNVATKANNSLSSDAASAQAALAIKIMKVKEEFLSLVRSITETSTFQVMANTALQLASALIKIADAIKPLLPLLAALAAIRIARGIGSFTGAMMGGLTSGRTFNKGGKVHAFASGGLVPGVGNRDTVPAMLSPGEFVIRKSSVNKIGAGTLHAMNNNRYADGGIINENKIGAAILENVGFDSSNVIKVTRKEVESKLPKTLRLSDNYPLKTQKSFTLEREGLSLNTYNEFSKILRANLVKVAENSAQSLATDLGLSGARTSIPAGDIDNFLRGINDGSVGNLFEDTLKVLSGSPFSTEAQRAFDFDTGLSNVLRDDYKNLTAKYVDAKSSLAQSGPSKFQVKAANALAQEAQQSNYVRPELDEEKKARESAQLKAAFSKSSKKKHFGGPVQRFATGGGVGTDTVPALLTPGEFVVNRKSAQSIGYGALNRMNKVGRYAKGGIVQRFSRGGTASMPDARTRYSSGFVGSGGLDPSQNLIPFDMLSTQGKALAQAQQQLTTATQQSVQAEGQQRRSISDVVSSNKMFAASMTVGLLQGFLPALNENSDAVTRMSHGLLGVVSTVTTVGFALEAFGVALNTQALIQFATGAGSLTQTLGNLSGQFSGVGQAFSKIGGKFGGIGGKIAGGVSKTLPTFASGGNMISSAFKGGMKNQSGLFSAVKSGAIGNGFASMGGSMGRAGAMSSMSGASGFQKFISQTSGKAGTLFGDLSKGFSGKVSKSPFANMGGSMGQKAAAGSVTNVGVATFGKAIGTVTKGLNAFAGPLLLVELGLMAGSSAINSFFDYQNQANKAIQEGNAAKASENAVNVAAQDSIDSFGSSAILAGAAIGSLVPGVGTLIGGVIGAGVALTAKFLPSIEKAIFGTDYVNKAFISLGTLFGGNTYNSIKSLAAAQAQGTVTQKALNDAGEKVTKAMGDLENGTISAAQAVAVSAAAGNEVTKQTDMNKKAAADNEKNKSGMVGGFLRGAARVGTLGLAGYMGLESGAQRNTRIDQENKGLADQSKKSQEELITKSTPAINAFSSEIAAAGGSFDDVLANLNDKTNAAYNPGLYQALIQQGTNPLRESFNNIKKEVERAQKAFNAMNLGMQNVQGAADAAALGVTNYIASQQAGNIALEQSLAVLEASVTSAAQGISDADFAAALGDAEATLRKFGANDEQVNKFKGNISAVNEVQKNQSTIFAGAKDKLAANIRKSTSAEGRREAFTSTIDEQLKAAGYDEQTRQRFKEASGGMSDEQLKKIGEGDFTAFEESIKELGKKTMEQVSGPLKAAIEIQKQVNELTKRRIELENNLISAQVDALSIRMEARDIQAKYGGKAVTPEERRANITDQANAQASGLGIAQLKNGSAAEITQRTQDIASRQAEIANIRRQAAQGNQLAQKAISGEAGLNLENEEKRLGELANSQIQTTRELIKAKEEELRTTQEKNKLEKQSLESLVNGDIEKFFEQQAAVGATAAIATGNKELMNAFGGQALGAAYSDVQRQQEAGVQTLYGRQLGGPGGLVEQSAGAALGARGITNPLMAQQLAGTTPEEEAIKSDIRGLAETMGPTADLQVAAAQQQLQAAELQIQAAKAKGEEAVRQMEARQMARGGVVYASRGIFVPRGTDTVPAMLTPGEFVVNRNAVNRGNNLQILRAMNGNSSPSAAASVAGGSQALSRGGSVQYLEGGGLLGGLFGGSIPDVISNLSQALGSFVSQMSENIKALQNTKFQVTLDSTNINVNVSGMTAGITDQVKEEIAQKVAAKIRNNYSVGQGGKLTENTSTLPK